MSLPMEFSFEGAAVRVVLINGEPWWIASDACAALELDGRSRDYLRALDDDEKGAHIVRTPGGDQQTQIINESGLYSLIFKSRKQSAKRFKKWVTAEVLPNIRKHGFYAMPATGEAIDDEEPAPLSGRAAAEEIVSAGRVFRALYTTGRSLGMARRLAATRANQAAARSTGVDLVAELGASQWLDGPDLPDGQRKIYELQQSIRTHLEANQWPEGFTALQIAQALGMEESRGSLMSIGRCLNVLGYTRVRSYPEGSNGPRPWVYRLKKVYA